jgi:hypothetical protein|tara:strand:+ start:21 stop:215 length:195 start_codon:yes stop_codon:yes gene_type:complete
MKVGDLVIMSRVESSVVGLVVKMPYVGPNGEKQQTPRVGVYWMDGEGHMDWEPMNWLEVVSESR